MNTNNQPPQKRPAKILNYDSDQSTKYPPLTSNNITTSSSTPSTSTTTQQPTAMTSPGYVTELSSLRNEIAQLKEIITMAMAQIKQAIDSFQAPHHHTEQSAMKTEDQDSMHLASPPMPGGYTPKHLDLPDIICDLKNDIVTISHKTRAMIK